jgi:hypothetical protein
MLLGSILEPKSKPQQSIEITGVFYQLGCGDTQLPIPTFADGGPLKRPWAPLAMGESASTLGAKGFERGIKISRILNDFNGFSDKTAASALRYISRLEAASEYTAPRKMSPAK